MPNAMNTQVPTEILWEILSSDPGIGVSILTLDGRIEFLNQRAREIFVAGDDSGDFVGAALSDLFPEPWVDERLAIFKRLGSEASARVVIRSIWNGRQVQSTIWRIPDDDRVLVLTRTGLAEPPDGADVIESKMVDLGPLSVLTTRELEVLALIGQGMRLKEIAKILYRAPKTIENHRLSIGRKLGETDRMRLAEIAREAELELSDAYLDRLEHSKPEDAGQNGTASRANGSQRRNDAVPAAGPSSGSINGSHSS